MHGIGQKYLFESCDGFIRGRFFIEGIHGDETRVGRRTLFERFNPILNLGLPLPFGDESTFGVNDHPAWRGVQVDHEFRESLMNPDTTLNRTRFCADFNVYGCVNGSSSVVCSI